LQVTVVMLPFAQPVFQIGSDLGRDWATVILLALIPVTVIEVAKSIRWGVRSQRPASIL
jgi:hypothetical protein